MLGLCLTLALPIQAQAATTNDMTQPMTETVTTEFSDTIGDCIEAMPSLGEVAMTYASQYEGNKYVYGGTDLENGIDCSGFVMKIYEEFGYSLPHSSSALRSVGEEVDVDDMQPGDIICFSGHVALYAGDGQMLHASNSKPYPAGGIKYSEVWYDKIITVRRLTA
jgi:cell wall-associated NlpC family hydrolase